MTRDDALGILNDIEERAMLLQGGRTARTYMDIATIAELRKRVGAPGFDAMVVAWAEEYQARLRTWRWVSESSVARQEPIVQTHHALRSDTDA